MCLDLAFLTGNLSVVVFTSDRRSARFSKLCCLLHASFASILASKMLFNFFLSPVAVGNIPP